MTAGCLKHLTKINIGGHGLIGDVEKICTGKNTAFPGQCVGLFHDTASASGDNTDMLPPEVNQGIH